VSDPAADRDLVRRTLAGESGAFDGLVRAHERGIFNLMLRMVRDRETARDLTQDLFVKVHRSLPKYDPRYPFTSWLYRVATNLCIDHIRRRRLQTVSLDAPVRFGDGEEAPREFPDDSCNPAADAEQADRARMLAAAMAELPEAQRLVLELRHQRDLSYDEIALVLGAPLGTVKARIHRGREALRKTLVRRYGLNEFA
jgi:RNA polymerase sigma-70 factor (ECF subfamily)